MLVTALAAAAQQLQIQVEVVSTWVLSCDQCSCLRPQKDSGKALSGDVLLMLCSKQETKRKNNLNGFNDSLS